MSFTLKIEFVGVCMFVPDHRDKTLCVLMPGTGHGHHVDAHVVRLCVDAAYLVRGSAEKSGTKALVAMDGMDLSLGRQDSPDFPPTLPFDVVNVGTRPVRSISLDALDAPLGHLLSGRLKLLSGAPPAPGGDGTGTGVFWTYECSDQPRRLVNRMWWTMEIHHDSLQLQLPRTALAAGGEDPEILILHPIGGVVEMSLYHTTRDDLPPGEVTGQAPPERGYPANHFTAYYSLFVPENVVVPIPAFWGDTFDGNPDRSGGSPYTCMLAQSPPVEPGM